MPFGRITSENIRENEVLRTLVLSPFLKLSFGLSGLPNVALRVAADHGEFAFRSAHQTMQIYGLRRYACGKATGCKPPTVVEALGIGFYYKREEAFAQSG
jgi:hypothetical protein